MRSSGKLVLAALVALVAVGMTGAGFVLFVPPAVTSPAPKRPPAKAIVSDPAEPPLTAEVSLGGPAKPVTVAGTTFKFDATSPWQGTAALTFKNAPPMRFTLTLAKMPAYDLESLTLSSGGVSLAVGNVSASATTKYFDARGRAQNDPERAAYTVTARRWDGGEVDVEVRRAPGAALGKALSVRWKSNPGYSRNPAHY
jgi:hypothetical protein